MSSYRPRSARPASSSSKRRSSNKRRDGNDNGSSGGGIKFEDFATVKALRPATAKPSSSSSSQPPQADTESSEDVYRRMSRLQERTDDMYQTRASQHGVLREEMDIEPNHAELRRRQRRRYADGERYTDELQQQQQQQDYLPDTVFINEGTYQVSSQQQQQQQQKQQECVPPMYTDEPQEWRPRDFVQQAWTENTTDNYPQDDDDNNEEVMRRDGGGGGGGLSRNAGMSASVANLAQRVRSWEERGAPDDDEHTLLLTEIEMLKESGAANLRQLHEMLLNDTYNDDEKHDHGYDDDDDGGGGYDEDGMYYRRRRHHHNGGGAFREDLWDEMKGWRGNMRPSSARSQQQHQAGGGGGRRRRHGSRPGTARVKPSTTVPKPFNFTPVDNQHSIVRQKFLEDMRRRQQAEEEPLKYEFHANPLPASTRQPIYEHLNAERERRSEQRRRERKEELQRRFKPFEFDPEVQEYVNERRRQFDEQSRAKRKAAAAASRKARKEAAAWSENGRDERIKARAAALLKEATLPRSVAEDMIRAKEREKQRRQRERRELREIQGRVSSPTGHRRPASPTSAGEVPNFKEQQARFAAEMEARKAAAREQLARTQVEPFRFVTADPPPAAILRRKAMESEEPVKPFKAKPVPKSTVIPDCDFKVGTTLKWEMMKERTQEKLFQREKERALKQAELEAALGGGGGGNNDAVGQELRLGARAAAAVNELKDAQSRENHRRAANEDERNFKEWKKSMKKNVNQRPLLVNTQAQEAQKRAAKLKALKKVKESLDEAHIQDLTTYFDAEEMALLEASGGA